MTFFNPARRVSAARYLRTSSAFAAATEVSRNRARAAGNSSSATTGFLPATTSQTGTAASRRGRTTPAASAGTPQPGRSRTGGPEIRAAEARRPSATAGSCRGPPGRHSGPEMARTRFVTSRPLTLAVSLFLPADFET